MVKAIIFTFVRFLDNFEPVLIRRLPDADLPAVCRTPVLPIILASWWAGFHVNFQASAYSAKYRPILDQMAKHPDLQSDFQGDDDHPEVRSHSPTIRWPVL